MLSWTGYLNSKTERTELQSLVCFLLLLLLLYCTDQLSISRVTSYSKVRRYVNTTKKRNTTGKAGCRKIAKHLPSDQSYCAMPAHCSFQLFGFDQTHGLCKLSFKKKLCSWSVHQRPLHCQAWIARSFALIRFSLPQICIKKKHHTAGSVGAAVRNALLWYPYVPGTKQQRVLILRGVRIINLILKTWRWVEREGCRLMYWSRVHLALSSFY